jgi:cytochrome c biogenesis protein CcdA
MSKPGERGRAMMKKLAMVLGAAVMVVPVSAGAAAAGEAAETNVIERIECLFRVYVTEGGEQGLDCLI